MKSYLAVLAILCLTACQAGGQAAAPASVETSVGLQTKEEAVRDNPANPHEKDETGVTASDVSSSSTSSQKSLAQLVDACHATDPDSCEKAGLGYAAAATDNLLHAADFYADGCDQSNASNCIRMGLMLQKGDGVQLDWFAAAINFRSACDLDDTECSNLGLAYVFGQGVVRDGRRAVQLFDKACQAGRMTGCANLGAAYMKGIGVHRDRQRAIALFREACSDGDSLGCFNLGVIYHTGQGVRRDLKRAATYYQTACDHDDGESCSNLGKLRLGRKIGARDPKTAAQLFYRGCILNDAESCLYLGLAHQSGDGVRANAYDTRSYLWRAVALDPKSQAARRALARLARIGDERAATPAGRQPSGE
ncbi:tetratricopeptide repeat protein [Burkholderia lata]|uniref:Sel1-like repeat protein n=1 Tax=Burkholderia lata (strain ATCC 17760 / DSM 23089 / LMG 22485 / NCIMB 9086 / R18194 / 383) TaxID=482957 RepID=Q39NM8_BURL3|nr:tetratricopeptide repeat protein [Burkholderia lata]ABB05938.1 Sel1-like repeat protein [Burkholderia lata]